MNVSYPTEKKEGNKTLRNRHSPHHHVFVARSTLEMLEYQLCFAFCNKANFLLQRLSDQKNIRSVEM